MWMAHLLSPGTALRLIGVGLLMVGVSLIYVGSTSPLVMAMAAVGLVAVVRLPDELPKLMLIPEGATSALSTLCGAADRDFESAEFNRHWRVIASHARVAHDMLSPRVLEALEALEISRLSGLIAVAKHLPRHTIDDHGLRANSMGPLPSVSTPGALTGGYNPALDAADKEYARRARLHKRDGRFTAPEPALRHSPPDGPLAPRPADR